MYLITNINYNWVSALRSDCYYIGESEVMVGGDGWAGVSGGVSSNCLS